MTMDKSDTAKSNYERNRIAARAIIYVSDYAEKHETLLNTPDRRAEW